MSETQKKEGTFNRVKKGGMKLLMTMVYIAPLIAGLILIFMRTNKMNVKLGYWLLLASIGMVMLMVILKRNNAKTFMKLNYFNLRGEGNFWWLASMFSYIIFIIVAVVVILFYRIWILGHGQQTDPPGCNPKIKGLYYLTSILFGVSLILLSYIATYKFGCLVEGICSKESMALSLLGIWLALLIFILSFSEYNYLVKVTDDAQ